MSTAIRRHTSASVLRGTLHTSACVAGLLTSIQSVAALSLFSPSTKLHTSNWCGRQRGGRPIITAGNTEKIPRTRAGEQRFYCGHEPASSQLSPPMRCGRLLLEHSVSPHPARAANVEVIAQRCTGRCRTGTRGKMYTRQLAKVVAMYKFLK